jgi:peptidoglycan/xylan/chitin deacetylase (PgdA/CDA1 family)
MLSPALDRITAGGACAAAALASLLRGPRLSILIFHRVLEQADPLFPGEMDARRFDRLMALVARTFHVLPLEQAAARLARRELPPRALAITFDDGYADNHDVALPILRRHGLTATFFVATGFLDGGRMWNDTVIECLRRSTVARVDLGDLGLPALSLGSASERRAAIDQLLPIVKYKSPAQREPLLKRLHEVCGAPVLPTDLMMRSEQVRALRVVGMGIGAHTVQHPILCSLPEDEAELEISAGRAQLEALIDAPVATFAYPNGKPGRDYDQRHARMVQRLGFAAAVSTEAGVSRTGDDLHQLKRFVPWDGSPLRWHARLVLHHIRG